MAIDCLPGVTLLPLAQPVKDGSIHRARLPKGTVIPVHTHPADEYVTALSGTVETGGRRCESGDGLAQGSAGDCDARLLQKGAP
jgi:anti-sigma factor ChrR (cupin superfamily)